MRSVSQVLQALWHKLVFWWALSIYECGRTKIQPQTITFVNTWELLLEEHMLVRIKNQMKLLLLLAWLACWGPFIVLLLMAKSRRGVISSTFRIRVQNHLELWRLTWISYWQQISPIFGPRVPPVCVVCGPVPVNKVIHFLPFIIGP